MPCPDTEATSDAYLHATMTEREAILGRTLFDVFPENPTSPSGGVRALRASLERVTSERRLDQMLVTKYEIPRPAAGGAASKSGGEPRNAPVFGPDGALISIIHHVEDVTARVRAEAALLESEEKYRTLFDSIDEAFAVAGHVAQRLRRGCAHPC